MRAARSSGLDRTSRERTPKRLAAHHSVREVERQPAFQRLAQKPLQGGARQNLRYDPLRPLSLACRRSLPIEICARERFGHDPLDDLVLYERPGNCFRQRSGHDTVDHLPRLRRCKHLPGHGLETAAGVDLGAAAGLGETLGGTSKRCDER